MSEPATKKVTLDIDVSTIALAPGECLTVYAAGHTIEISRKDFDNVQVLVDDKAIVKTLTEVYG